MFEYKQMCKGISFPMPTNTALGSDHTVRDNEAGVEVSLHVPLHKFSPTKHCETNVWQICYSMPLISSFFIVS